MSPFKRLSLKILLIEILVNSVKCDGTGNRVNLTILLDNTKEFTNLTEEVNGLKAMVNYLDSLFNTFRQKVLKHPSGCVEIFENPMYNRGSGSYIIQINGKLPPFGVYCLSDPDGGLPWTIVQRRIDGSTNFNRNWTEYERGFGDLSTNFFIGLDKLHSFTSYGEPQELWVKLTDRKGVTKNAYYDRFAIGSEAEKYPLSVLGKYSGDAGDSLIFNRGKKFSTFDNDNDKDTRNCAEVFMGGWWFDWCFFGNLNGIYGSTEYGRGLIWYHPSRLEVPMQYAHMAIRPVRT